MPAFQVAPWKNDDGTYNGVPWTWGFSGLTYRMDNVPEPQSWQDILDPKYKGRVSTVDGAMNNVGCFDRRRHRPRHDDDRAAEGTRD